MMSMFEEGALGIKGGGQRPEGPALTESFWLPAHFVITTPNPKSPSIKTQKLKGQIKKTPMEVAMIH